MLQEKNMFMCLSVTKDADTEYSKQTLFNCTDA